MILIDAGPLVALSDDTDQLNQVAAQDLKKLALQQFAVCLPVLGEAFFHVRGSFLRQRLRTLLRQMSVPPITSKFGLVGSTQIQLLYQPCPLK